MIPFVSWGQMGMPALHLQVGMPAPDCYTSMLGPDVQVLAVADGLSRAPHSKLATQSDDLDAEV